MVVCTLNMRLPTTFVWFIVNMTAPVVDLIVISPAIVAPFCRSVCISPVVDLRVKDWKVACCVSFRLNLSCVGCYINVQEQSLGSGKCHRLPLPLSQKCLTWTTFELTVKVLPTVWLLKLIWTGMFELPAPVDPEAEV